MTTCIINEVNLPYEISLSEGELGSVLSCLSTITELQLYQSPIQVLKAYRMNLQMEDPNSFSELLNEPTLLMETLCIYFRVLKLDKINLSLQVD